MVKLNAVYLAKNGKPFDADTMGNSLRMRTNPKAILATETFWNDLREGTLKAGQLYCVPAKSGNKTNIVMVNAVEVATPKVAKVTTKTQEVVGDVVKVGGAFYRLVAIK